MEYTHWWGQHLHWFWIVPLLCIVLMIVCATLKARRAGSWRCCFADGGRERFDCDRSAQRPVEHRRSETPFQILDRRYASGEITGEQYEQMKGEIESGPIRTGPRIR